jgi:hypothetical protein
VQDTVICSKEHVSGIIPIALLLSNHKNFYVGVRVEVFMDVLLSVVMYAVLNCCSTLKNSSKKREF